MTGRGHVYRLGVHRLMCGDSSSPDDLVMLLDGEAIDMVNMDPPYNVHVEPRTRNAMAAGNSSFGSGGDATGPMRARDRVIENDEMSDEDFGKMLLAWFGNAASVLKPGGTFYIWGGYANLANYPQALKATEVYFSQCIVWDKEHPVIGRKDFMGSFELCFYGWRSGAGHKFYGPNNATDLWHVKKVSSSSRGHLTEKPVALAVQALQYSSKRGQNVLDLFGGSGSTLMGCEQTGRHAYLMELDPLYCDVIRKRWAEFVHGEGCDWQALTPAVDNETDAENICDVTHPLARDPDLVGLSDWLRRVIRCLETGSAPPTTAPVRLVARGRMLEPAPPTAAGLQRNNI